MSNRPLYDARLAGIKCIGIGGAQARIPTEEEVANELADIPTAEEILAEEKANSIATIRQEGSADLRQLVEPYSEEERATWFVQESEARAYLLDNTAQTPMLTALSTARGIPIDLLADKIMANVTLFQTASGQILGDQQKQIDIIEAG